MTTANPASNAPVKTGTPCVDDLIESYSVPVSANLADAVAIDFRGFRGGEIVRRSGSVATITLYASTKEDGTFGTKYSGGSAVTVALSADNEPAEIPIGAFGSRYLKLIGDAAGVVDVCLKG